MRVLARSASVLIPYSAVAVGVYGLHSAWAALGIYHVGILAFIIFSQRPNLNVKPRKISSVWMLPAALVFSLGGLALYYLWPYLSSDSQSIADKLLRYGLHQQTWPLFAVYFSVANAVLEELFWRGRLGSNSLRPVTNDLLFGGYHVFVLLAFMAPVWALPVFVCCAFAGWLWRVLRMMTGGLAVPIVTHVVADVSIALAVHLRVFA